MALPRLALLLLLALSPSVEAETSPDPAVVPDAFAELADVLQLGAQFEVMRDEGLAQATSMAKALLPEGPDARREAALARVYDLRRMRAGFLHALRAQLGSDPATLTAVNQFFAEDLGLRVLSLEISARRAFLDIAAEEAARVAADTPETARDPKWKLIERLITAGDLVEMNVAVGLSGHLAFLQGLQEAGANGLALPIDQLAAETWGQEDELRVDTTSWLKAYFGLAYSSLSEAELEAYVTFLESPEGRRYSAALFVAYDSIFRQISQDLGRALGEASQRHDI